MTKVKLAWDSRRQQARSDRAYVRERSADPYHSARWTKLSRAYRAAHPLCAECMRNGRLEPSTCVDHITPWPICQDSFYDESNLQALCDKCNHDKGQRDKAVIAAWRKRMPEI